MFRLIAQIRRSPIEVRQRAVAYATIAVIAVVVLLYGAFHLVRSSLDSGTTDTTILAPYEVK